MAKSTQFLGDLTFSLSSSKSESCLHKVHLGKVYDSSANGKYGTSARSHSSIPRLPPITKTATQHITRTTTQHYKQDSKHGESRIEGTHKHTEPPMTKTTTQHYKQVSRHGESGSVVRPNKATELPSNKTMEQYKRYPKHRESWSDLYCERKENPMAKAATQCYKEDSKLRDSWPVVPCIPTKSPITKATTQYYKQDSKQGDSWPAVPCKPTQPPSPHKSPRLLPNRNLSKCVVGDSSETIRSGRRLSLVSCTKTCDPSSKRHELELECSLVGQQREFVPLKRSLIRRQRKADRLAAYKNVQSETWDQEMSRMERTLGTDFASQKNEVMRDFEGKVIHSSAVYKDDVTVLLAILDTEAKRKPKKRDSREAETSGDDTSESASKSGIRTQFLRTLDLHFFNEYHERGAGRRMAICEEIENSMTMQDNVSVRWFREHLRLQEVLDSWVL